MDDKRKKRTNSFRKIFPNFFSLKTKHSDKEITSNKSISKTDNDESRQKPRALNTYEDPVTLRQKSLSSDKEAMLAWNTSNTSNIVYGQALPRLGIHQFNNDDRYKYNSENSSSSTLVSGSGMECKITSLNSSNNSYSANDSESIIHSDVERDVYNHFKDNVTAKPQVPRKPLADTSIQHFTNESINSHHQVSLDGCRYPDKYYHSLKKDSSHAGFEERKRYADLQDNDHPCAVGAEIKSFNTKFSISPKKDSTVKTNPQLRAKSFSLESRGNDKLPKMGNNNAQSKYNSLNFDKPYNYSAPTTPTPPANRLPNMPKIISPYGHVRKTLNESEDRRNSLNKLSKRVSSDDTFKGSTKSGYSSTLPSRSSTPQHLDAVKSNESNALPADFRKHITMQNVEAFAWHKLKELKVKEEEYLLKQTLHKHPQNASSEPIYNDVVPNNLRSSGKSIPATDVRKWSSLPRGSHNSYCDYENEVKDTKYFHRGMMARNSDIFVKKNVNYLDPRLLCRNRLTSSVPRHVPSQQVQLSLEPNSNSTLPHNKRVSFEAPTYGEIQNTVAKDIYGTIDKSKRNNSYALVTKADISNYVAIENQFGGANVANDCGIPPASPVRGSRGANERYVGEQGAEHGRTSAASAARLLLSKRAPPAYCASESGSELSELQNIFSQGSTEDDWHTDGSRIDGGLSDGESSRSTMRSRSSRRDDPRRHTLAGNHVLVHPHHHPHRFNGHDIQPTLPHGYQAPSSALLFDDDPGIMSEVETSSTGFRRGGKQRSSLPVVRTPSKTLERPLGLVFLQYRNETKRALLPNEITSIDTVKALFVRSFPKQLSMQYMDSPLVKIYIHDSSKDMFYELEDMRAHLRDIGDRSVLRLFESADMGGGGFPGALGVGSVVMPPGAAGCSGPSSWDQDQSYFSEPEIDSEYHHQHIHKTKVKAPAYYMGTAAPSALPRGGSLLRAFSPAAPPVPADRVKTLPGPGHSSEGYMSSPERGPSRGPYEDPYYTQFLGPAGGRPNITPIIDEEVNEGVLLDESYQLYAGLPTGPRPLARAPYDTRLNSQVEDMQRLRVEKMERQLANLTGLVQKALQAPGAGPAGSVGAPAHDYSPRPSAAQDAVRFGSYERAPKLGKDKFQKSVSFEKSVSFSDDPPDMNSPKQHSPQHAADTKPPKPAIKSSTLPRTSSQERDRLKPAPPPKPVGLVGPPLATAPQRQYPLNLPTEVANQLKHLQKQSRDLRIEARNLRRSALTHAMSMRQLMAETVVQIGELSASFNGHNPDSLSREEEMYRQDMLLLENDLYELEATVEKLRGQAANRESRVNMADIERIAMVLSKSSKTVADWKLKFPILQETMKIKLAAEMEKVVRKEKILEEEPERLELALRRCKKLTGTLVTLKRLACVQEQRLPCDGRTSPTSSQASTFTGAFEEPASDAEPVPCHIPSPHSKHNLKTDTSPGHRPCPCGFD